MKKPDERTARSNTAGFCPCNKSSACVQRGLPSVGPPNVPGKSLLSGCDAHPTSALCPEALSLSCQPKANPGLAAGSSPTSLEAPCAPQSESSGQSRGRGVLWVVVELSPPVSSLQVPRANRGQAIPLWSSKALSSWSYFICLQLFAE